MVKAIRISKAVDCLGTIPTGQKVTPMDLLKRRINLRIEKMEVSVFYSYPVVDRFIGFPTDNSIDGLLAVIRFFVAEDINNRYVQGRKHDRLRIKTVSITFEDER